MAKGKKKVDQTKETAALYKKSVKVTLTAKAVGKGGPYEDVRENDELLKAGDSRMATPRVAKHGKAIGIYK